MMFVQVLDWFDVSAEHMRSFSEDQGVLPVNSEPGQLCLSRELKVSAAMRFLMNTHEAPLYYEYMKSCCLFFFL